MERLELHSPLQLEVAEERLAAALPRRRSSTWSGGDPAPVDVLGRVRHRRVRLTVLPRSLRRNSWAPAVWGRLVIGHPHGSRLVGRIGWPPSVRVGCALYLGMAVALLAGALVGLGLSWAHGDGVGDLPFLVAIPAVLVIAGVVLPWYGGNRGLRDRPYLLDWLRTTLEVGRSQ